MYISSDCQAKCISEPRLPEKSGKTSSSLSGHCIPVEVKLADRLAAWEVAGFSKFKMDAQDEVNPDRLQASISSSHHKPAAHLPTPSLPSCCFFSLVCSPLPQSLRQNLSQNHPAFPRPLGDLDQFGDLFSSSGPSWDL